MILDIFQSTKHWMQNKNDHKAEPYFQDICSQARKNLPKDVFTRKVPLFLNQIKETSLYKIVQTMPKAVLHNIFLDGCLDVQFYRKVILKDQNIYLTENKSSFRISTSADAWRHKWISMKKARESYKTEEEFIKDISKITLVTAQELKSIEEKRQTAWSIMLNKISSLETIIYASHIFPLYLKHVLSKFINNGYERLQLRISLVNLVEYCKEGNFIKKLSFSDYRVIFDKVLSQIKKDYPFFSLGLIVCFKSSQSQLEIERQIEVLCRLNWALILGIDFIDDEEFYSHIEPNDKIVEKVLAKYPDIHLQKVYHVGQSKKTMTNNQQAVHAGSIRIGHGLNILRNNQFLPYCKFICFEKCVLDSLMMGESGDSRQSTASILLGLGYAVSLNYGHSGIFGIEDSTFEYVLSMISFDWRLKHIKLAIIHSINYSLSHSSMRKKLLASFYRRWNEWTSKLMQGKVHEQSSAITMKQQLNIFGMTQNWEYSEEDEKAQKKYEAIRLRQLSKLPPEYFGKNAMSYYEYIRSTQLYEILKTIPKGVLHHHHIDCSEDEDFYKQYIISDPNVYLTADKKHFILGTKQQASREKWISFDQLKKEIPNRKKMLNYVSNLTMLSKEELQVVGTVQKQFWVLFEEKISNFFPIYMALHIFKKYLRHSMLKYIKNGYERVQFRALLVKLLQYDAEGNMIKQHDEQTYMKAFDEVYFQIIKEYPYFSAGVIFFGLKVFSQDQNFDMLDKACSYGWQRHVGIDFVQQQDPFGSMQPYIRTADKIVKKYPHMNLKKVYHSGQTRDHLNNNVQLSVKSGAVRIGHGLNIVKKMQSLQICKNVCFELNPISNLLTGGMIDMRISPAPILLGLGYPVSISSDDPGKFGYEDTTVDYFASAMCFNWGLKHLKLIAYHSINHALISQGERISMIERFNGHWNKWIQQFIEKEQRKGLSGKSIKIKEMSSEQKVILALRINHFKNS